MKKGVLLVNLGTPDEPTPFAVRRYLREFLSDSRVIEIPKIFWLFILYIIILPFRSYKSAKLYQKIWTEKGSPLRVITASLTKKLQAYFGDEIIVEMAMRYGNPSIESVLIKMRENKIDKLIILPLYPQYSAPTTATTFDEVARILKSFRYIPKLYFINDYHVDQNYISAVANSIAKNWKEKGKTQKLLFSFHGLPKLFIEKGDPYYSYCLETADLIAKKLNLNKKEWSVSFQSRLGKAEWLKPYTDKILVNLPSENIKSVTVVCPGFSVDCLETLEEINLFNQKIFLEAGGEIFNYVPALNDSDEHVTALTKLIENCIHTE
jgi:ferrochelatase